MKKEQRLLIAFDDVVNALTREYGGVMDTHIYSPREIINSIGSLHPVDAVEVVHGRWEKQPGTVGQWRCSVCERGVPYSYTGHNYCPNCGAKMDGERGAEYEQQT